MSWETQRRGGFCWDKDKRVSPPSPPRPAALAARRALGFHSNAAPENTPAATGGGSG
ncbi:MAG: hypothetical protein ACRYFX_26775 [Janthinobacterium lividum]